MTLVVYGAAYSVYSRILRLALIEKNLAFDWVETDVFDDPAARTAQADRHPFAKIPTIEHDGFALGETQTCLRYLDSGAFGPPTLTPSAPRDRARADEIVGLLDAYGYQSMVWDVFVERRRKPFAERREAVVARGVERASRVLVAIEARADPTPAHALIGGAVSLADVFLAPMLTYFDQTDEGRAAIDRLPRLSEWRAAWRRRPSIAATRSPLEAAP